MINSTAQTFANFAKVALKLPYNLVRWFCGRVVSIVSNISNFLTGNTCHNNGKGAGRTSLSARHASGYRNNSDNFTGTVKIADLAEFLDQFDFYFASQDLFEREKKEALQTATKIQEETGAQNVKLHAQSSETSKAQEAYFQVFQEEQRPE